MKAFHEVQFPVQIGYGASGGPEFNTSVITVYSGHEQRNINWAQARGRWDISTGIKNSKDMQTVIAFFRARYGKGYGFRFKDWADYKGIKEYIGTGDGECTQFQLVKCYNSGESEYKRDITKPVEGRVQLYMNDKAVNLDKEKIVIDYSSGVIKFKQAVLKGIRITADYEFDVPARFDTDQLNVRIESYQQYVWDAIPIVELRV